MFVSEATIDMATKVVIYNRFFQTQTMKEAQRELPC
jgi:hypothetical protein